MYLDWHHGGIRMGSGAYMFRKYFSGVMDKDGKWNTEESVLESWNILESSLGVIEKLWLPPGRRTKFMFSDQPSIADLSLAGEITNLEGIAYPLKDKFPSIYEWMYVHMMSIPKFKELHEKGAELVISNIKSME